MHAVNVCRVPTTKAETSKKLLRFVDTKLFSPHINSDLLRWIVEQKVALSFVYLFARQFFGQGWSGVALDGFTHPP